VQIIVEVPPDRDALVRATRHMAKRALWRLRILGLAMIAFGAVELLGDRPFLGSYLLVLGLLLVAVLPELLLRRTVRTSWLLLNRPGTFRCDEWGVEWVSELHTSRIAWQLVERMDETPGQLVFRVLGNRFLFVPSAGLTREEIGEITAAVAKARAGQETMAA
jgi:hypothetical protein